MRLRVQQPELKRSNTCGSARVDILVPAVSTEEHIKRAAVMASLQPDQQTPHENKESTENKLTELKLQTGHQETQQEQQQEQQQQQQQDAQSEADNVMMPVDAAAKPQRSGQETGTGTEITEADANAAATEDDNQEMVGWFPGHLACPMRLAGDRA